MIRLLVKCAIAVGVVRAHVCPHCLMQDFGEWVCMECCDGREWRVLGYAKLPPCWMASTASPPYEGIGPDDIPF